MSITETPQMQTSKGKKAATNRANFANSHNDKSSISYNTQSNDNSTLVNSATDIALLLNSKEDEE